MPKVLLTKNSFIFLPLKEGNLLEHFCHLTHDFAILNQLEANNK